MSTNNNTNKFEHPCFPQPIDTQISVWRYTSLPKFIALLTQKELYLSRLDQLSDPHEGSTPAFIAQARDEEIRAIYASRGQTPKIDMGEIYREQRERVYVNCWRMGNEESEAMWRLYCPSDDGVAIKTKYSQLVDSIDTDEHRYIGCVRYIDYESEGFPWNNLFYPVMHKRASFSHEREVRLVKSVTPKPKYDPNNMPLGITHPWHAEEIASAVYVNPYAPEFYFSAVRSVIEQFSPSLTDRLFWSSMRRHPTY